MCCHTYFPSLSLKHATATHLAMLSAFRAQRPVTVRQKYLEISTKSGDHTQKKREKMWPTINVTHVRNRSLCSNIETQQSSSTFLGLSTARLLLRRVHWCVARTGPPIKESPPEGKKFTWLGLTCQRFLTWTGTL